jgi:ASC-1-like (ASCH) protein
MKHSLKIEPQYLQNLLDGKKRFEVRINDRDYQVGDELEFWDSDYQGYRIFKVLHIHSGLGMKENYVGLSVEQLEPKGL